MTSTLEHIDDYFAGNLSDEEKELFAKKCGTDPAFAQEVGFYISARAAIRSELHAQKKKEFEALYIPLSTRQVNSPGVVRRLTPYITLAAACFLLFISWLLFLKEPSPQQLASAYVEEHLYTLSVTMGGSQDSLQLGIAAFNRGEYAATEGIFQSLTHQKEVAPEAIKNLGILYLVRGQYDKAIAVFDSLSANQSLYANPGPFYKAVTLLKRSEGRDQAQAKEILQEVIEKRLPGSKEAEEWIKQW
jgi:tetratricopeptide (TPR) repeat protein